MKSLQRLLLIFLLVFAIFCTNRTNGSELPSQCEQHVRVLDDEQEEVEVEVVKDGRTIFEGVLLNEDKAERGSFELVNKSDLLDGIDEEEEEEEEGYEIDFDSSLSQFMEELLCRRGGEMMDNSDISSLNYIWRDSGSSSLLSFSQSTLSNLSSSTVSNGCDGVGRGRFYSVCDTGTDRININISNNIHSSVQPCDFLPVKEDDDDDDDVVSVILDVEEEEFVFFDPEILDNNNLTIGWIIKELVPIFKEETKILSRSFSQRILEKVQEILMREVVVHLIEVNYGETLVLVGDIHGQYDDLIRIFTQFGYPSKNHKFIFNGDIIDRGPNSMGCLLLLFTLKIAFPDSVFITRGNHETKTCNGEGTFTYKDECHKKYPNTNQNSNPHQNQNFNSFFELSHQVFAHLPLAFLINSQYFVCHGGIPDNFDLTTFTAGFDEHKCTLTEYQNAYALLWNDPHNGDGMAESDRGGCIFRFGGSVTRDFLDRHNLILLIRSHQYCSLGYRKQHSDRCITIFSAPNYCGIGNVGSVMIIKPFEFLNSIPPQISYQIFPINTDI